MTRASQLAARRAGGPVTARASSAPAGASGKVEAFTFGDPEPVLDRRTLMGLPRECLRNGRWYTTPVNMNGLTTTRWASPHHASAMQVKVNMLVSQFVPHPLLNRATFKGLCLDYIALANAYVERIENIAGRPMRLERPLAKYIRRGIKDGQFFQLSEADGRGIGREHEFETGSVLQLKEPDLNQEIYGLPEYLGAIQPIFLNEAATIFRRRYYQNGSHAGFILYSTDSQINQGDVDGLRQALKDSKGPGNFRNVFLHAPGGKKDGIQLIPISEVQAKDEFAGIKNISRDDTLAAHRVPPQLLGIVPANAGGFGDVGKAADVFYFQEIEPLQAVFEPINEWLGQEVVRFREYERRSGITAGADTK